MTDRPVYAVYTSSLHDKLDRTVVERCAAT